MLENDLIDRLQESCESQGVKPDSAYLDAASLIFRYCRFLRQRIIANPRMLLSAMQPEYFLRVKPTEVFRAEIKSLYSGEDPDEKIAGLRKYKYQEILRVILKELRRRNICDTFIEMGNLASGVLEETLDLHYRKLVAIFGTPTTFEDEPIECAVIGLGKLGANELNFSSDIDLLFVYESDEGSVKGGKGVTVNEFFCWLFSNVLRAVSAYSPDGFLFRVDANLRPEGKYGVLANSREALIRFYENFGGTFERLALIRARGVAGSMELARNLVEGVSSFVFRRSLDTAAIDEILSLKTALERGGRWGGERSFNVKLDTGGIREIEFVVNALQLIYGGRIPALRTTGTIRTLDALMLSGVLDSKTSEGLKDSYLFLRRIEHLLQMFDELQTHELPFDGEKFDLVVSAFDMSGEAFLKRLHSTREYIRRCFEDLFIMGSAGRSSREPPVEKSASEKIIDALHSSAEILQLPETAVFRKPVEAEANLNRLVMMPASPFHPVAYAKYRNLAINMLDLAINSPDPDKALLFTIELVKICSHSSYLLDVLDRNREGRKVLYNIFSASSLISRELLKDTIFLERMIIGGIPLKPSTREGLESEKEEFTGRTGASVHGEKSLAGMEEMIDFLRILKSREIIKIAALDLGGALTPYETGELLSDLADFIIEEVVKCAFEMTGGDYGTGGFAVIGLGRLGAREMSYLSDLDLIFLFDEALLNSESVTRRVQKTLNILHTHSRFGKIYDTDMGLRPSGKQGTLVSSLEAFREYHRSLVSPWEKFAIMKARFICGDVKTWEAGREIILESLSNTVVDADFVDQIHKIRQKMIKEIARDPATFYDLKAGRGGLADVEFISTLLQLRHINKSSPVLEQNTFRLLRDQFEKKIIDSRVFEVLYEGYAFLTLLKQRLRLYLSRPTNILRLEGEEIQNIAALCGYGRGEEGSKKFLSDLRFFSDGINDIYTRRFI